MGDALPLEGRGPTSMGDALPLEGRGPTSLGGALPLEGRGPTSMGDALPLEGRGPTSVGDALPLEGRGPTSMGDALPVEGSPARSSVQSTERLFHIRSRSEADGAHIATLAARSAYRYNSGLSALLPFVRSRFGSRWVPSRCAPARRFGASTAGSRAGMRPPTMPGRMVRAAWTRRWERMATRSSPTPALPMS